MVDVSERQSPAGVARLSGVVEPEMDAVWKGGEVDIPLMRGCGGSEQ